MSCVMAYSIITPGVALAMLIGIWIGRLWPRKRDRP